MPDYLGQTSVQTKVRDQTFPQIFRSGEALIKHSLSNTNTLQLSKTDNLAVTPTSCRYWPGVWTHLLHALSFSLSHYLYLLEAITPDAASLPRAGWYQYFTFKGSLLSSQRTMAWTGVLELKQRSVSHVESETWWEHSVLAMDYWLLKKEFFLNFLLCVDWFSSGLIPTQLLPKLLVYPFWFLLLDTWH